MEKPHTTMPLNVWLKLYGNVGVIRALNIWPGDAPIKTKANCVRLALPIDSSACFHSLFNAIIIFEMPNGKPRAKMDDETCSGHLICTRRT